MKEGREAENKRIQRDEDTKDRKQREEGRVTGAAEKRCKRKHRGRRARGRRKRRDDEETGGRGKTNHLLKGSEGGGR